MSGERQVKIRWTSGERLVNVRWTSIWAWLCWTWNFSKFHFLVRPCLNTSFSSKFHPTGLERNYFNSWFQTQTHIADLVQFIACEVERGGSSESGRVRKHSHNMRTSKKSVVFVFDQNCIHSVEPGLPLRADVFNTHSLNIRVVADSSYISLTQLSHNCLT